MHIKMKITRDIGKSLTVKQKVQKSYSTSCLLSNNSHCTLLHTSYTVFMRKSNECCMCMHVNNQSAFKINNSLYIKSRRLIGKDTVTAYPLYRNLRCVNTVQMHRLHCHVLPLLNNKRKRKREKEKCSRQNYTNPFFPYSNT